MIEKILPLNSIFFVNTKLFTNCLENVSSEIYLDRPNINSNNMAFVACHIVDARFYIAKLAGAVVINPFEEVFEKIKSPDQKMEFPHIEEIVDLWKELSQQIEKRFESISNNELLKEAPLQLPLTEKTIYGGLSFLIQHEAYHIGQLAFLRKYFGLSAMRYI